MWVFVNGCVSGESAQPSSPNKEVFHNMMKPAPGYKSLFLPSHLNSELVPLDVIPPPALKFKLTLNNFLVPVQSFSTTVLKTRWLTLGHGFIKSHPAACCMRSLWARLGVSDLCLRGLSARASEISQRLLSGWLHFKLYLSSQFGGWTCSSVTTRR